MTGLLLVFAGVIMLALMWLAEFPLAATNAAGVATGSTNPIVNYHVIYALALVVVAATAAGSTWGLGNAWARTRFVRDNPWAR